MLSCFLKFTEINTLQQSIQYFFFAQHSNIGGVEAWGASCCRYFAPVAQRLGEVAVIETYLAVGITTLHMLYTLYVCDADISPCFFSGGS